MSGRFDFSDIKSTLSRIFSQKNLYIVKCSVANEIKIRVVRPSNCFEKHFISFLSISSELKSLGFLFAMLSTVDLPLRWQSLYLLPFSVEISLFQVEVHAGNDGNLLPVIICNDVDTPLKPPKTISSSPYSSFCIQDSGS